MNKDELISYLKMHGYLKTEAVINAFEKIPRENFVNSEYRKHAYENYPLPTESGQTISQPLTVAMMTEALDAEKTSKILEIGAGSGYQAAVLSMIATKGRIITTEIIPQLFETAKKNLRSYRNVTIINTDGSQGYEKEAPYDRIIVTAAAPDIPEPLIKQLKEGGRMVIPVSDRMYVITKRSNRISREMIGYFSFVPLRGKHGVDF